MRSHPLPLIVIGAALLIGIPAGAAALASVLVMVVVGVPAAG